MLLHRDLELVLPFVRVAPALKIKKIKRGETTKTNETNEARSNQDK
jgi:hypothetical protein